MISIHATAATKYTTDDLRVLMGMDRLSDDSSMTEIRQLLSKCYQQKEYNELVNALEGIDNAQIKEFQEKEDAWYSAKEVLEANFINNKPIKTILDDYAVYKTAELQRVPYTEAKTVDLDLIDASDIEAKIKYAQSTLDAANDNTNIGVIGYDMETFTKADLSVITPFGNSISIDTGKSQVNDGLTIAIQKNHKIYSQFKGKVTKVTNNSVSIKTGKSIVIEYIGIAPSVRKNEKVKQYSIIGNAKSNKVLFKFKLNTVYVDPLLLYGSRSNVWYDSWANFNPGCMITKNDYSNLKDRLEKATNVIHSELNSAGTATNKDGTVTKIIVQGENSYTDTADNITIDKFIPEINVNKN